jgi:hypothetical protein
MKSKKINMNKMKNWNWDKIHKKFPNLNPFADSDRDGVVNINDCKPFNKWRKEIIELNKISPAKRKSILQGKKYLYHKTEYQTVPQMLKTNKLQRGNVPLSTSEISNPNVIYKKFKQPVVLVLKKKQLKNLQKIDYDDPNRKSTLGSVQFKNEREWTTTGSETKKALKGVILNEKVKETMLPQEEPGLERVTLKSYPTRFATPDEFQKTKLKFKIQGELDNYGGAI